MAIELQYIQAIPQRYLSTRSKEEEDTLVARIQKLKKEKNAFLLCHNYQNPEIHRVADAVGDSYGLSAKAKDVHADRIVFCGVRFMAETAFILNPEKIVLLPESEAGCGLADEITADDVRALKKMHPGVPVVMYINCSAEVKAESDVICTSSNALHIVQSLPGNEVIFGPDTNLADFVSKRTSKKVIPWQGYCPVHKAVTKEMLEETLTMYSDAVVIVHPECNPDVAEMADEILSTSEMLRVIGKRPEKRFIVGTEIGLIQKAQEMYPEKEIYPIYRHKSCDESCACPYMKITSLKSIERALLEDRERIFVEPAIAQKALRAVEKMLEFGLPSPPSMAKP